jgi:CubicO group peptidase (beta-lactamase class C family)
MVKEMLLKQVDEIFEQYLRSDYFAGGVCYASVEGEKVFHQAYGFANHTTKTPCQLDTLFDLASVTKIMTTTVVLKLISQKLITLSGQLGQYLPSVSHNRHLACLTVRQLLTHTSGLRAWYPLYTAKGDVFSVLDHMDVLHGTDQKVVYSDLNFILLGEMLKHLLQDDLASIMQQQIAEPLGLETLTYYPKGNNIAATEFGNRIEKGMCKDVQLSFSGWRAEDQPIIGEANDGNAYYFFAGLAGHAGLFSNVIDIARIGELYLKGGNWNGSQIIDQDLVDEALTNQVNGRGLGWEQSDLYPGGFGHTGFTGTALWIEPSKKICVVLLTNRLHVKQPQNIKPFRREVFTYFQQRFG